MTKKHPVLLIRLVIRSCNKGWPSQIAEILRNNNIIFLSKEGFADHWKTLMFLSWTDLIQLPISGEKSLLRKNENSHLFWWYAMKYNFLCENVSLVFVVYYGILREMFPWKQIFPRSRKLRLFWNILSYLIIVCLLLFVGETI